MRSRTKIRSCATILGLLYILLLDPAFVASAPVSVEEGDYDVEGGCYYMLDTYQNGEQIRTNEPCLNCTCSNNMLMCYLKTCPFTKPIGSDCKVERTPGQCCPTIKCPEVPVMIPESHPIVPVAKPQIIGTTTISVAQHFPTTTALSVINPEEGCYANKVYYAEGSQVPSSSADPCDLCYCIQNHTACVKQRCILEIAGCTPKFREGVCCPVGYDCDGSVTFAPTTPTTTTTTSTTTTPNLPATGCFVDDEYYYDGSSIVTGKACNHCYCLQGKVVCAIQDCDPPVDGCLPVLTDDHCCPFKYDCSSTIPPSLNSTEEYSDFSTTPETRLDDDALVTLNPDTLKHIATNAPAQDEEITTAADILATSVLKTQFEEKPEFEDATTLSPAENEDGSETTTLNGEEKPLLIEERIKISNETLEHVNNHPSIPVESLPETADISTTSAPIESEEVPVITEESVQLETTVKINSEDHFNLQPQNNVTSNFSLLPESQVIEQVATTELNLKTESPKDDELFRTTIVPQEFETTQLSVKESDNIHQDSEASTPQVLNDDAIVETTLAPEFHDSEQVHTTALPFIEHIPEVKDTTFIPEVDLATTEKFSEEAVTKAEVIETTAAKVEDEESNLVEESILPEAKPTENVDKKPELPEEPQTTPEVVPVPTSEVPAENRLSLTEAPPKQETEAVPHVINDQSEKVTTEPPSQPELDLATTQANEEKTNTHILAEKVTSAPEQASDDSTTLAASVTESAFVHHFDAIPGEGDCLQNGVTYSNGAAVQSIDLCRENCTCNSSLIICDKIRCEKPASFRHLACTEVFEDRSCCPKYICVESSEKGHGVLQSDSLVTEAESEGTTVFVERIDHTTSLPLEQTTAQPSDLLTPELLISEKEKLTTPLPSLTAEVKSKVTTAVPQIITSELPEQQFEEQPATTELPKIELHHDTVEVTTDAIVLESTNKVDVHLIKEEVDEIQTTPAAIVETTVGIAVREKFPSLEETTEKVDEEAMATTVAAADKVDVKLPQLTKEPEEEPVTTVKQEIISEEELTTIADTKLENEQPAADELAETTPAANVEPLPSDSPVNEEKEKPEADEHAATTSAPEDKPLLSELPVSDEKPDAHKPDDQIPTTLAPQEDEVAATTLAPQEDEAAATTLAPQEDEVAATTIKHIEEPEELVTSEPPEILREKIVTTQSSLLTEEATHEVSYLPENEEKLVTTAAVIPTENPTNTEEKLIPELTTKQSLLDLEPTTESVDITESPHIEDFHLTKNVTHLTSSTKPLKDEKPATEKPEELLVETTVKFEFTSPVAVTEETLAEDDDPHQPGDSISFTSPPLIEDRIKVPSTSTISPSKDKSTTIASDSRTEAPSEFLPTTHLPEESHKEQHHTTLPSVPLEKATTLAPEIPALATTIKLVPESQVLEHFVTTTVKEGHVISVTTPSTVKPDEPPTKTPSLLHPTTPHQELSTLGFNLTTHHAIVSTHPPETTTHKEPEKLATVPSITQAPTTTSHHLPSQDKLSPPLETHVPEHEEDYEEHTEDYFLPDLGIPITSDNFTLDEGECIYESRLYKSAQQIPRDDPCDFCFCFRGDIICLQQSCPPPIEGCYEETIPGFCCPRFECPVTAVTLNVSEPKVPYPVGSARYRSARAVPQLQVVVCEFRNKFYSRGEAIKAASSPCMDCICAENGTMKCTPKKCQLDPFWHSLHGFKKSDKIDIKRAGRNRY